MRVFNTFITAVCFSIFLIKLRWPKTKSLNHTRPVIKLGRNAEMARNDGESKENLHCRRGCIIGDRTFRNRHIFIFGNQRPLSFLLKN